MAILVDTHKIYSKLIEAGFEQAKANAIVESFGMAQESIATKGDIDLLRQEMKVMEQKIMVNMWVVGTALVGVMAAFNFLG